MCVRERRVSSPIAASRNNESDYAKHFDTLDGFHRDEFSLSTSHERSLTFYEASSNLCKHTKYLSRYYIREFICTDHRVIGVFTSALLFE